MVTTDLIRELQRELLEISSTYGIPTVTLPTVVTESDLHEEAVAFMASYHFAQGFAGIRYNGNVMYNKHKLDLIGREMHAEGLRLLDAKVENTVKALEEELGLMKLADQYIREILTQKQYEIPERFRENSERLWGILFADSLDTELTVLPSGEHNLRVRSRTNPKRYFPSSFEEYMKLDRRLFRPLGKGVIDTPTEDEWIMGQRDANHGYLSVDALTAIFKEGFERGAEGRHSHHLEKLIFHLGSNRAACIAHIGFRYGREHFKLEKFPALMKEFEAQVGSPFFRPSAFLPRIGISSSHDILSAEERIEAYKAGYAFKLMGNREFITEDGRTPLGRREDIRDDIGNNHPAMEYAEYGFNLWGIGNHEATGKDLTVNFDLIQRVVDERDKRWNEDAVTKTKPTGEHFWMQGATSEEVEKRLLSYAGSEARLPFSLRRDTVRLYEQPQEQEYSFMVGYMDALLLDDITRKDVRPPYNEEGLREMYYAGFAACRGRRVDRRIDGPQVTGHFQGYRRRVSGSDSLITRQVWKPARAR